VLTYVLLVLIGWFTIAPPTALVLGRGISLREWRAARC